MFELYKLFGFILELSLSMKYHHNNEVGFPEFGILRGNYVIFQNI